MKSFIRKHRRCILIAAIGLVILLLKATPLLAQVPEDNILDGIVSKYRDAVAPWRAALIGYTERLFWMLVTLEFTWTGIDLLLRKADSSEVIAEVMRRVMVVGFYLALIRHSDVWYKGIIDGFRMAASSANASITGKNMGINPSDIFDAGIEIALRMTESMAFSSVGLMIATAIAALFIIAIFAVITGQIVLALVEMYIALGASVILLGFGGSRWTRDFATNQLRYVVSVDVKLFGIQIIVGIGGLFVMTWFRSYEQSWSQVVILLGASIILAMLITTVPALMQGLITGASVGGAAAQTVQSVKNISTQAAGVGIAAGALGAGLTAAGVEAYRATSSDDSLMKRFGGTAVNFGRAAVQDSFAKMAGNPLSHQGNMGGRMASDLRARRLSSESQAANSGSQDGSKTAGSGHTSAPPSPQTDAKSGALENQQQAPNESTPSKPLAASKAQAPTRPDPMTPPSPFPVADPPAQGGWNPKQITYQTKTKSEETTT